MLPAEENQSKEWLTREEAETDWEYGERPENRSMEERLANGLVVMDKPAGIKSHEFSIRVKEELERGKTGHSGTLDPDATGVLPIGLDRGTKVLQALKEAGKVYVGEMELDEEVSEEDVRALVDDFVGTNTQVPPEMSAVKREEREREVYELEILGVDGATVRFRVACEKGFYVRTFCRQFGEKLGTEGEMSSLRRTKVGVFGEEDTHTLDEAVDAYTEWRNEEVNDLEAIVLPVEAGVRHLKKVLVKDSAVASICHGANLGAQGISRLQEDIEEDETVALLTLKGELIALADASMTSEEMVAEEGTAVDLKRVFMGKDLYPKEWRGR